MYEVEVKVPAENGLVRPRLEEIGVTPMGSVVQVDTYFDAPHRSFAETDEALRIRSERRQNDDVIRVTYKGPLVDDGSKTREEIEMEIEDGDRMGAILENLGFEPAATVRKDRDRFTLEGGEYTITLDDVDGVGEYVEVETSVDDESDLDAARRGVYDVLERMDLDPADQIRTSYLELLLESTE
ncbi:class IV adenylate cyclase [Natrarchaeobius chitinivorans]|uniref:Class IV adenylate cyclase n=1 Tax=Natrarchaeobius chitinivorans TaxID=1679083 RepID=A0A3N6P5E1_NATCH|nr:class IV adenylate cyclase [Natrarchaeobius chitinivorans]RQG90775.1 class IV adenylate cyclase [Natrarchaeobius chitinivorans]